MTGVSVVIPSLDGGADTLESVPDGVEVTVVTDGGRAEARNIGSGQTHGDILVFIDDDVAFDESWFWRQVEQTPPGVVTGLEDHDFGMLLTRFLIIHRSDFERIGGFDDRMQHIEDTEFCLRARKHRLGLRALPRDSVDHEDHANDITTRVRVKWLWYTLRKHPALFAPHLIDLVHARGWQDIPEPDLTSIGSTHEDGAELDSRDPSRVRQPPG